MAVCEDGICSAELARAVDDAFDALIAGSVATLDARGFAGSHLGQLGMAGLLLVLGGTFQEPGALWYVAAIDLGPGLVLQAVYGHVTQRVGHARIDVCLRIAIRRYRRRDGDVQRFSLALQAGDVVVERQIGDRSLAGLAWAQHELE